ncbi:YceK/YidQ family lipoprotein [Pseudomonas kitaguniensis]|uniref:YceK/YidQ family lipoprotein n=1 Tax=Pseudomonas kitaguniensis TaxID=2607908 RepID=UPI003D048AD0
MTLKMTVALLLASLAVSGCGTTNTVLRDDMAATHLLRQQKTYCQSVPRVYSGVAFDFCVLNAPLTSADFLLPVVLLDIAASGIVDTVLLPYTIYRQNQDGSIEIYR